MKKLLFITLVGIVVLNYNSIAQTVKNHSRTVIKKVIVEDDGEKTMTITTNENGKEETKVYKGKEVDEYLKKNKGKDKGGHNMVYIYESKDGDNEEITIDIDIKDILENLEINLKQLDDDLDKLTIKSRCIKGTDNDDSCVFIMNAFGEEFTDMEKFFENFEFDFNFSNSEDGESTIIIKKFGSAIDSDEEQIIIKTKNIHKKIDDVDELLNNLDIDMEIDIDKLDKSKKKKVIIKRTIIIEDEEDDDNSEEKSRLNKKEFEGLNFYPNPSNDVIYIEVVDLKIEEIRLVNILGQEMFIKSDLGGIPVRLNVESVDAGLYYLTVKTDRGIIR